MQLIRRTRCEEHYSLDGTLIISTIARHGIRWQAMTIAATDPPVRLADTTTTRTDAQRIRRRQIKRMGELLK